MSTVRPRSYRQRRNKGTVGGTQNANPDVLTSVRVPVKSRLGTVDRLTGNDRSRLPLTALQAEALGALSDVPAWPSAIAAGCSLSAKQATTAVLALSAKGLAVKTAGGWRRT